MINNIKVLSSTRFPQAIGEHTRAVLAECGYSDADIERLIAAGVAVAASKDRDNAAH